MGGLQVLTWGLQLNQLPMWASRQPRYHYLVSTIQQPNCELHKPVHRNSTWLRLVWSFSKSQNLTQHVVVCWINKFGFFFWNGVPFSKREDKCKWELPHTPHDCVFYSGVCFFCEGLIACCLLLQLPEDLVCVYADKETKLLSTYLYNRLSKEINKVDYEENSGNPYTDYSILRLTTTIQLSYKFSTKKGQSA